MTTTSSSSPPCRKPSGMSEQFSLTGDGTSRRLDVFLSENLSITRTRVKQMIEQGHVFVNGLRSKASLLVKPSMVIEGTIPDDEPLSLEAEAIPLEILYEDTCLIVINKAAGIVVHPSAGHSSGTLVNAILAHLGVTPGTSAGDRTEFSGLTDGEKGAAVRPGVVHRLDKGTTGVIIMAKDPTTQELLSRLFKERAVQKIYRAIVEGEMKLDSGTIEGRIGRHPVERKKMAVLEGKGRDAQTSYRVLGRSEGFSYVEAYPRTGRTHQIRVHLAHIGHPVVGDPDYGRRAKTLAERPLLHALKILFPHPRTETELTVTAPVPEDMKSFLAACRFDERIVGI